MTLQSFDNLPKTVEINNISVTILKCLNVRKFGNTKESRMAYTILCINCNKPKIVKERDLKMGVRLRCADCNWSRSTGNRQIECSTKCITKSELENKIAKYLFKVTSKKCNKIHREFNLSVEDIKQLIFNDCIYCGRIPNKNWKHPKIQNSIQSHGIDRIDSSIGYIKENCVTCCKVCNMAKGKMSVVEFYKWLDDIAKFNNYVRN